MIDWFLIQLGFIIIFAVLIMWQSLIGALAERAKRFTKTPLPPFWEWVMRFNLFFMIISVFLVLIVRPQ